MASEMIATTIASAPVVVFSKSWCGYCAKAKRALSSINIQPLVIELDQRDDGDEIQSALAISTGQRTVPSIFLNGKHIGGSSDVISGIPRGMFDDVNTAVQVEEAEESGASEGGA